MKTDLTEQTRAYLFASVEEMERARLPAATRQRLLRLRDMYSRWLADPRQGERDIVAMLRRDYALGSSQAYEDVRLIKLCLGALNQADKDYERWLFRERLEEGYRMAREAGDVQAFGRMLAVHAKAARLDKDEPDAPAYADIVPAAFDMTADPAAAGLKPVSGWRERARRLEERYQREASMEDADFEELPAAGAADKAG